MWSHPHFATLWRRGCPGWGGVPQATPHPMAGWDGLCPMSLSCPQDHPGAVTRHGKELEEDARARRQEEGRDRVTWWGWRCSRMGSPPIPPQPSCLPWGVPPAQSLFPKRTFSANEHELGQTLHPTEPFSSFLHRFAPARASRRLCCAHGRSQHLPGSGCK